MSIWSSSYRSARRRAKEIYSKIGKVACPAFSGESVAFNNKGFTHLVRKGRIPRGRPEQRRRLALIPYAKEIISSTRAIILFDQREVHPTASVARFWTFMKTIDGRQIKVVVRQIGKNGQRHFFSIMEDAPRTSAPKQKTRH